MSVESIEQGFAEHKLPDTIEMGTGTWAWGDRLVWGFGKGYSDDDVRAAFEASVSAGVRFFDTAEMYGFGTSERLLGRFIGESGDKAYVATKFFPLPWRLTRGQLIRALRGSLKRLGLARVDLYQIHWHTPMFAPEKAADALADALDAGLIRAAGVSNYNREQTVQAHHRLAHRGFPLASNQVEYSLLNREIERDGTMAACREHNICIIAYSPLAMGLLTGKYTPENPPPGYRGRQARNLLPKLAPLIQALREIGDARGGKSAAQVAINWTMCKGTVPIPGAKNAHQMEHNAGAIGWRLTADEVARLDEMSEKI
jgi:aryl-alcohol dehydrogenase-like predicted oxidoreductase